VLCSYGPSAQNILIVELPRVENRLLVRSSMDLLPLRVLTTRWATRVPERDSS
jgi:hypothetical protein